MRPLFVEFMDSGGWCFEFSDLNGIYVLLICCECLSEFERWRTRNDMVAFVVAE